MNRNFFKSASKVLILQALILLIISSCKTSTEKKSLTFRDFPDLKIGFTSQNFQKAMPLSVPNLTEIIEFASKEGFQFIELRDDIASLAAGECNVLAEIARNNNIEVIYEIQKNPLDTGYFRIFNKALENSTAFSDPGILRVMISKSEFAENPDKTGWSGDELNKLIGIVDSSSSLAEKRGLKLIVENSDEPFFGDGTTYFGLSDFFSNTTSTCLQFDISNPFRKSARVKADPDKVMKYMSLLGSRWVASHIKTIKFKGGEMQPVLTENPLPVEKVINLMGKLGVTYVALELLAIEDKEQCLKNHKTSIEFLRNKDLIK